MNMKSIRIIMVPVLFWLFFVGLMILLTITWFIQVFQPIAQGTKKIEISIMALNETLANPANKNIVLPTETILEKGDVFDVGRVSAVIQQAADAQQQHVVLLDITQTNVSSVTTLTNIQREQLDEKNIEAVMYSINVQGSYQSLLGFLTAISQEKGMFVQYASYVVGDYPDAILSLTIKTYRLAS